MLKCKSIKWYHFHSPLGKRESNWSRNASRSCFWDRYWGLTCHDQLLAIILLSPVTSLDVFAKARLTQFPSRFISGEFRPYSNLLFIIQFTNVTHSRRIRTWNYFVVLLFRMPYLLRNLRKPSATKKKKRIVVSY